MKPIRNSGIFAHVDAGKTTLTEQMLSRAGAIRSPGSVDVGTAHTDNLPVERRRGISVKATCVSFPYNGVQINLIDTPGHVDFSAEVVDSVHDGDCVILNTRVPVQTSLDYSITLAAFTSGRGAMSVQLHGYRECPLELGATAKRRSVDPLDMSKYILAARSALGGGIFNLD